MFTSRSPQKQSDASSSLAVKSGVKGESLPAVQLQEDAGKEELPAQLKQNPDTRPWHSSLALTPPAQLKKGASLDAGKQPVQFALTQDVKSNSSSKYDVEYTGYARDFEGGGDPGGSGITGVSSYGATARVYDRADRSNPPANRNVNVNAAAREYHQGHILAKDLGGSGFADNIFQQDGGQNTTGNWPSFERQVGNLRDDAQRLAPMTYRVVLNGAGGSLRYDQAL